MKKNKNRRIIWSFIMTSMLVSCSSEVEEFATKSDEFSDEILEKISYGCDASIYSLNSDEKIETVASDEYLNYIMNPTLPIINKSAVVFDEYVGVIKADEVRGCGKYQEVEVYYDCENSKTATYSKGFRGSWSVLKNITMKFCVVPDSLFKRTNIAYGVVDFTSPVDGTEHSYMGSDSEYKEIARIDVRMDAEDKSPETNIKSRKHGENWIKGNIGSMNTDSRKNLTFRMFVYLPQNGADNVYPDLGFDYGVFGNIYSRKDYTDDYGIVFSDDEDDSNANKSILFQNNENGQIITKSGVSCHNVILQDGNTRFYMSKIKTKN